MTGFRSSKSTPHISDEEMQEEIMACLHAEDWLMVKNEFGGLDWEEINAKLCDMFPQEDNERLCDMIYELVGGPWLV